MIFTFRSSHGFGSSIEKAFARMTDIFWTKACFKSFQNFLLQAFLLSFVGQGVYLYSVYFQFINH